MQKIVEMLPIIVIAVAVGFITLHIVEKRRTKEEPGPEIAVAKKVTQLQLADDLSTSDRRIAERAFHAPEEMDAVSTASAEANVAVRPPERPSGSLLSEMEFVEPETLGPAGNDQYFQKDFESLRTDAVRNPDSAQNRATVNRIMQIRQQRLQQEKALNAEP